VTDSLSLRLNFFWTFAGNIVYAGCQWCMLMVLAKVGTPDMVGQFSLGLAVTAPLIMLANLQLRTVQATDAKGEYCFCDYLALRLFTTVLVLIVIVVIVMISRYSLNTALVIIAIGLAKCFEAVSDIFYGVLQQHERMDRIAISMMSKGLFSLISLGITVYFTNSVFWGAIALGGAWAVILLGYDVRSGAIVLGEGARSGLWLPMPAVLRPRWDANTLCQLAWLALPLGVVMMFISLNANIPRYFVQRQLGEYGLGIYSAMAYLVVAGGTVIGALGQSASPKLARYYAAQDWASFNKLLGKLFVLGAGVGVAGILVALIGGGFLLSILYTPEYAQEVDVLVWLMVGAALSYVASFAGYGMTAARCFKLQLPLFVAVTLVSVSSAAWLVPRYGLMGAALAVNISNLFQLAGSMFMLGLAVRHLRSGGKR